MIKKENAEEDYITTPISVLSYISELEIEIKQLLDFKEFTNMIIRRNLNKNISDYEAIMFIDEKLTKETKCTKD